MKRVILLLLKQFFFSIKRTALASNVFFLNVLFLTLFLQIPSVRAIESPILKAPSFTILQDEYQLEGVVTDKSGKPLQGVTVRVLSSKKKSVTITDKEGKFRIYVNSYSELLLSMIGYQKQTIKVQGKKSISVAMQQDEDKILDEVVTTGYSKVRRETFTGAATVVTRKELEKFNNNNIFSVLQALEPAFKVEEGTNFGSNPNVIPQINIRGVTSVGTYQANAPLVILDGFEVALQTLYDMDVKRIQSIAILKDASSTSLYGSRGANGVIVIETRLPKDGKFTFSYTASPSLTVVDLSDYNMMNAKEKLEYEKLSGIYNVPVENDFNHIKKELYDNVYASRLNNVLSGVDTYWLYQPVQSNLSINHSLRMEGGGDEVRYSLEGGYNDFKGVMKESGRKRGNAGFTLIYRIKDKFTFSNVASYQITNEYNSRYGDFSQYVNMNPYERIYDENGDFIIRYNRLDAYNTFGQALFNPLYDASLGFRSESRTQFLNNNVLLDWRITPSLRIISRGVISKTVGNRDNYTSPFSTRFLTTPDQSDKGSYSVGESSTVQYSGNLNLEYNKTIDKHQFFVTANGEIRSNNTRSSSYVVTGFNDDRLITPSAALKYATNSLPVYYSIPNNAVSIFGTLLYTYNNKYTVNTSLRSDGSSLFGELNRFAVFWSTGLSYNMHYEDWFKNKYVTMLRLFGNVGTNGSEGFNGDMLNTAYRYVAGSNYYKQFAASYASQGNPLITWPNIKQISVGMQMGILGNALNLNLNYYDKITTNMISPVTVAPSLGFAGNSITQNLGNVSNKGFEITSNIRLLENEERRISWYMTLGAVQNRSKLLKISNELRERNRQLAQSSNGNTLPTVYFQEGQSLSIIRGVRSLGIDPATGKEVYLDRNDNVTYTWNAQDQVIIGNSQPTLFGNISSTFNYKQFSVQLFGNYLLGQDAYNQTLVSKVENNSPYVNADRRVLLDRWREPGDQTQFKSIAEFQNATQVTSRFLQNEKSFRLTSINVNYEFPAALTSKYNLQRLRLNFSTNDMVRLSNVRMERGISYPFSRTYNFGLTVDF